MSVLRDHIDSIVDSLLEDAEDPADIIDMLGDSIDVAARARGIPNAHAAVPDKVRQAVLELVAYNWADEEHDYELTSAEMDDPTKHIFNFLQLLDDWLKETE